MLKWIGMGLLALFVVNVGLFWWNHRDLSPEAVEQLYLLPEDRFVDVGGMRVRVREQGPDEARPLLLVHGATHSLESWDGWAETLDDEFRVIRYDMKGHGLTGPDPQERYSPEDRALFIGEMMDALGLRTAVVAGNSLGGLAAWRFAADNPERVDALVLVAPAAFSINGVTDEAAPIPPMVDFILRAAPRWGVRASAALSLADQTLLTEEEIDRLRAMWRLRGNGQAMVRSIELFTLPAPEADLARVVEPTLIIWGAQDALIPVEQGPMMAELIPDATLVVHDDLGHTPHAEAPERTSGDVRVFLRRLGE